VLTGREATSFASGSLSDLSVLVAQIARHGPLEMIASSAWFALARHLVGRGPQPARPHPVEPAVVDAAAVAFQASLPQEAMILRIAAAIVLGDHVLQVGSLQELAAAVNSQPVTEIAGRWLDVLIGGGV
jgi:hypothetical protein